MEPCFLDALDLSKKIKAGEISCKELIESCIKRVEKFEPNIKAWNYFDKEYLLNRAKEADDLRVSGKPLGSLHGIPVGIKDIFATGDMPTECGTSLRKGRITKNDATVISLLRDAGAIIMGKTVTTEFAYFDPGKTCNPHDISRTPGGSSSGSAASVASYMCPLSIGSQTNGSVIRPASFCGVYGFKPTFGLVSRFGALRQSRVLDQVGFFSRSINDIALISEELIRYDSYDEESVRFSGKGIIDIANSKPPLDPTFAFIKTPRWKSLDKDTVEAFKQLEKKLGKRIEECKLPDYFEKLYEYHKIVMETDMANSFKADYQQNKNKMGKKLVEAIERGLGYKSKDYAEAIANMKIIYDSIEELFDDYDAFITPSALGQAPAGLSSTGSPEMCTIWTYLGMPSLSLPLLAGSNNLPIGVQLVGQKFEDARLLRTGNWLSNKLKKIK